MPNDVLVVVMMYEEKKSANENFHANLRKSNDSCCFPPFEWHFLWRDLFEPIDFWIDYFNFDWWKTRMEKWIRIFGIYFECWFSLPFGFLTPNSHHSTKNTELKKKTWSSSGSFVEYLKIDLLFLLLVFDFIQRLRSVFFFSYATHSLFISNFLLIFFLLLRSHHLTRISN